MSLLALDTETELFPPLGTDKVHMRYPCPPLVCVSAKGDGNICGVYGTGDTQELRSLLLHAWDSGASLVFHNAAFDVGVLCKYSNVGDLIMKFLRNQRILDTRVLYFLRYPDPPGRVCSLGELSEKYLSRKLDKGDTRLSFKRGQVLTDAQRQYALQDAVATYDLAKRFLGMGKGSQRQKPWNVQMHIATEQSAIGTDMDYVFSAAAAWKAFHLTSVGMELDLPNLARHHEALSAKVGALGVALHSRGLAEYVRCPGVKERAEPGLAASHYSRRWEYDEAVGRLVRARKGSVESIECRLKKNLRDIQDLAIEVEKDLEVRFPRSRKTGKISLKRDDWIDYIGTLPEELELFFEFEKQSKYLSTFTQPLVDSGARRVHSDYYIPGAATGRWSCTKPNLQQVWKGIRDIYRAKEGHVLVSADYPTLELYTLAQTMHGMGIKGPLLDTLNAREDIHTKTAESIFGDASLRQGAKACNFGLPGGMGARRFAAHAKTLGLEWDIEEAKSIRNRWLNHYWDVKQYLRGFDVNPWYFYRGPRDWQSKQSWLRTLGFKEDELDDLSSFDILQKVNGGRHYTVHLASGRVLPDRTYTMASNSFFQGLGADIITYAFVDLCERLVDRPEIRIVAVVHDSIVLEAPKGVEQAAAAMLEASMLRALHVFCPAVNPPREIVPEISERWS